MTPAINIKRATPGDAELLSDLSNITFIETYRGSCADEDLSDFIDKCFSEEAITKELEDENNFYYIAYADGFPAGYMRLNEDNTEYPFKRQYKALQLKRIYLLKEFQSKKIGSALMSYALQLAADKDYEILWLGVWEENENAKSFYAKWGFEDHGLPYSFQVGDTTHTDYWLMKFIEKN